MNLRLNPRTARTVCLGLWALAATALLWAQGGGLDARRARDLIRRLGGGEMEQGRVRVKNISAGIGGSSVIVEAQIETAFRFTRDQNDWRIAEIRLADGQWESIELVEEAVRREKIRRTAALLQKLGEGLEAYRRARGNYVVTDDIAVLVDHLSPQYLSPPLRFDLWGVQFDYRGLTNSYRLASAGPDRRPGTGDDLVVEDGRARPTAESRE